MVAKALGDGLQQSLHRDGTGPEGGNDLRLHRPRHRLVRTPRRQTFPQSRALTQRPERAGVAWTLRLLEHHATAGLLLARWPAAGCIPAVPKEHLKSFPLIYLE
jgi:hypothetical protein